MKEKSPVEIRLTNVLGLLNANPVDLNASHALAYVAAARARYLEGDLQCVLDLFLAIAELLRMDDRNLRLKVAALFDEGPDPAHMSRVS